jgi:branched-chain amino acid aminotransferase
VRVTLTRGVGGHPFDLRLTGDTTLAIQVRPLEPMGDALPAGVSVVTAIVRRNETSSLSRIKSLNCLDNILARAAAQGAGYDDALFLNTQGRVAEATSSNVFAMVGGELVTPPPSEGLLPGIARAVVMELIPVVERPLTRDDLADADEVFITNSVTEVVPVTTFDDDPVGTGDPGPMTRAIHAAYRAAVRADAPSADRL